MKNRIEELNAIINEKEKELLALRKELVALKDAKSAIADCKFGTYDKWYRYHRKDEGEAYDKAWVKQNEITKNDKITWLEGR